MRNISHKISILLLSLSVSSCEKIISIPDPIDTITTSQVFSSDVQAAAALGGLYNSMINDRNSAGNGLYEFSNGQSTIYGGLSADELTSYSSLSEEHRVSMNWLLHDHSGTFNLWKSAYNTIYGTNAIIEGVAASTSAEFSANGRKRVSGEARFIRAFCYFYLVNFFGDVPLALTVDFNETRKYARASTQKVYEQIIDDLLIAQADLPPVNTNNAGERIYPDKWAATALLARVYLYNKEYENAYKQSNDVINNLAQFKLETDIDKTFLKESREAIWQLKQNTNHLFSTVGNATPEGYVLMAFSFNGDPADFSKVYYPVSDQLLNAFEPGDKRYANWIHKSSNTSALPKEYYYSYKYKTGVNNAVPGGIPTEYYVVLRLAEQYLIRAEAAANGAAALSDAIGDLNALRGRANIDDLPLNLTKPQVIDAVAQERRVELFVEWGHRWFDLKRTGKAESVLSQIPLKQPWQGVNQLLYPIPPVEILHNPNLKPNPGYN